MLGGGGAKGAAHVGALLAIEEAGVPIDIAVGTSVGSFVSGLYATGKTPEQIKTLFLDVDWNLGYQDQLTRSHIPNRRKRYNDAFPIQLDIGLDTTGIKLPKGVIQGQGMKLIIDGMLGSYSKFESFDDLGIPYRAVATDLETGEQVVLSSGDLGLAMQASMSIPGVLRPTELNGRVLVDGGIANNLPVSVAKAMGADIIIAVDIGAPPLARKEINSSVAVLGQMSNFLTKVNQEQARALLSEKDVLIRPDLEDMGMLDFERMPDALEQGYNAAKQAIALHPSLSHFPTKAVNVLPSYNQPATQIQLTNNSRLSDKYLLARMQLDEEGPHSQEQVNRGTERLLGQGTIARVTTSRELVDGEEHLFMQVDEKEWGPGYLDFEFSFEDNFRSFSRFEVGAAWRYTNLNPYGAEWVNSVEFGTEKNVASELYWPLNTSGFFLQSDAKVAREVSNYIDSNNQNFGEVIRSFQNAAGGIGYEFTDNFDVLTGLEIETGRVKLPDALTPLFGFATAHYDSSSLFIKADYDSLDNADFSREGWRFNATARRSKSNALGLREYADLVEISLETVFSMGPHSVKPAFRAGSTYATKDQLQFSSFELGGFLNLSGNDRDFIAGPHMRFLRMIYTYELAENSFGGTKLPLYLGASYEAGNVWEHQSHISWDSMISSGAVFLGWDSPIGPAFLGYGRSEKNQESVYISLGKGL